VQLAVVVDGDGAEGTRGNEGNRRVRKGPFYRGCIRHPDSRRATDVARARSSSFLFLRFDGPRSASGSSSSSCHGRLASYFGSTLAIAEETYDLVSRENQKGAFMYSISR